MLCLTLGHALFSLSCSSFNAALYLARTSYSLSFHINEWLHPAVLGSHALCLKILVVPRSVWKEHSMVAQVCQPGEFLGPVTLRCTFFTSKWPWLQGVPRLPGGSWGAPECVLLPDSALPLSVWLCFRPHQDTEPHPLQAPVRNALTPVRSVRVLAGNSTFKVGSFKWHLMEGNFTKEGAVCKEPPRS